METIIIHFIMLKSAYFPGLPTDFSFSVAIHTSSVIKPAGQSQRISFVFLHSHEEK